MLIIYYVPMRRQAAKRTSMPPGSIVGEREREGERIIQCF